MQSSGQSKFLGQIKAKISESAPNHVIGKYPYDDLWVYPPIPTMLKTLNVEDFHLRGVFVWIPEFTFPHAFPEGRPPCPRCKTASHVIAKGFTQKESRRGVLRDSCCDLLGFSYHCHGCESKNHGKPKARIDKLYWYPSTLTNQRKPATPILFAFKPVHLTHPHVFMQFPAIQNAKVPENFRSWDVGVMAQLPLFVQESFRFILTHKSAVHLDVMEELTDNLVHAKGFAASRAALEQAHRKEVHARELRYYSMLVWRKQNLLLQSAATERPFGSFDDPDGYNGFVPSAHYLSSVWTDMMQTRPVAKLDKLVQGVEGEV